MRLHIPAAISLTLVLLACATPGPPVQAAAPPLLATAGAAADTPFDAPAGAYVLDPRHTSVVWRVRHQNFSMFTGRFDKAGGALTFDPAAPSNSKLTATVDLTTLSTSLKDEVFDRQLAQALGMDRSRDISFVANRITRTGEKTARIDGDMTMNGRTHAETIDATFEGYAKSNLLSAKPRFGFSGHALIKRSDFGATNVILSTFAGDEVEILIEAEFEKA